MPCTEGVSTRGAGVYGRAVVDGHPLAAFDVVVVHAISDSWQPRSFSRADGCFAVDDLAAGPWKLIVDGHGAMRTVDLDLVDGETRSLGTIVLHHGFVVRGRVVDRTGAPVAGADVFIDVRAQSRSARTNGFGEFVFTEVSPGLEARAYPVQVEATAPGLRNELPVRVEGPNAPVEIVLVPTGAIDGTISGASAGDYVDFRGANGVFAAAIVHANGTFRADAVPAGSYNVNIHKHRDIVLGTVTVIAGQTASLSLAVRPPGIDIAIRGTRACMQVELRTLLGGVEAKTACTGPRAWLQDVQAGPHELCVDGSCESIRVDAQHTSFEFP